MLADVGDTRWLTYRTFDANGDKALAGTATLVVTRPDGTTQSHNTAAVTPANTDDGAYGFALTFNAAGWWQWVWANTGGDAVPGVEAGSTLVGLALYPQTPWCSIDDVLRIPKVNKLDDPDMEFLDRCRQAATEFLHSRTWRRFRGLRAVELRPCCTCAYSRSGSWLVWPMLGGRTSPDGPSIMEGPAQCGCGYHSEVELPDDVRWIEEVLINGDPFDDWRLDGGGLLVRTDSAAWPCCSDVTLPSTADNTFAITAVVGEERPELARMAAAELAGELVLATAKPTDCTIPTRVTQLQSQGQTYTRVDTTTLANDGYLGLRTVDIFLSQFGKRRRRAMIASPDTPPLARRVGRGPLIGS